MKQYLITGASRGIGRATAIRLAEKDCHIFLHGRDEDALKATAEQVITKGAEITILVYDLSKPEEVEKMAKDISVDKLDLLVNNAGIAKVNPFEEITLEEWNRTFNVNVTAPFLLTKLLAGKMPQGSSIVNILSVASKNSFPGWSTYCMSKFALDGFMKGVREELREKQIRVINLYPSAVATDIWNDLPGDWNPENMMRPEAVAESVYHAVNQPSTTLIEDITITNLGGSQ